MNGSKKTLTLELSDRTVSTVLPAFVVGILNCTPDSFFAQSRGGLEEAMRLVGEGADIIDVGAESTRPGSRYVDASEEICRLVPVVSAIRKHSDIPISVDTRKGDVLLAALDAGADMLNDVSALEDDAGMADLVAKRHIPVVLMHKRGVPGTMQSQPLSVGSFGIVDSYLRSRVAYAMERGIEARKIIVDPGIGFGKDDFANAELVAMCGGLCGGEYPVLMSLSRKSFLGNITGRAVGERLAGTISANLVSVLRGARMLRVHDVGACRDSLAVLQSILGQGFADADASCRPRLNTTLEKMP